MNVDLIRSLANEKGLSLTKLEEKLGFGNGTIGKWATKSPTCDKLYAVADFLSVSTDYLLGRTDNPYAHKTQVGNSVNGNYNAVDNSSVTVNSSILDEHKKALLDIYGKLSPVEQAQLLVEADKMRNK